MPRKKHRSSEEMLEMLSSIDIHSAVAVYLQIENQVQFAITAGKLHSGEQLPSVRELSDRLQINANTVAKAYRDLEIKGLLYTRRGKGVFVRPGVEEPCRIACTARIVARMHEVMGEARAAGLNPELVAEVISTSLAAGGSPYSDTPQPVLKLARKATRKD